VRSMFTKVEDETISEDGALFSIDAGTIIHIQGIPLRLAAVARVRTHPANAALIDRLEAERDGRADVCAPREPREPA
jgi:hypothetical protein